MDIKKKVQHAAIDAGFNFSGLAREMGQTPQNLTNKLTRNDMKVSDLEKIADALNCELVLEFKPLTKVETH